MSDHIKHECGLALIRLLKPLPYYQENYKTCFYGLQKLHLLMQKQRNRGQDGAGLATIKLNIQPGKQYISVRRSNSSNYLQELFEGVMKHFEPLDEKQSADGDWLKDNMPFMGELLLGHLRYGTHGANTLETVHPFLRENNWISRNLAIAGNFNMTNVEELFQKLVSLGQFPKFKSDTITVLEKIGHFLDEEVQMLFDWYKPQRNGQQDINPLIFENLDVCNVLRKAARKFDGGYVIAGMIGHGDAFVLRDPNGIRPAFYYQRDDLVAMASERPALQTAFEVGATEIREIQPGHALIIKYNGKVSEEPCLEPGERKSCSFERIYFSRGNDLDIYQERKKLGRELAGEVIPAIGGDFENTVFTAIPNTAETAFLGLTEALNDHLDRQKIKQIIASGPAIGEEQIRNILQQRPRVEKLVVKDDKMRTFIANDHIRGKLVSHIYDVTYGIVHPGIDTLVALDDSIVRGTTLRDSIVHILSTLKPRKIIIASSAPQIRYPDCYGIDMSELGRFVAFVALVALLNEEKRGDLLKETKQKCLAQQGLPPSKMKNYLAELYDLYPYTKLSEKIGELLTPPGCNVKVEVIYQTLEGLHNACPNHPGDWYFSGEYPTPGGLRVLNTALINYMDQKGGRSY
ncbi:MAG: amidophosphoribosyltransferase [Saprospiraceae bacterium]|jgi:amidophosphoribosyltransferase|nr:amidophosphoribosyltransferase [Saprospiraceae bacterium]MBP9211091.1 amidophosphoribosyltransferase [Saprospiraceae bacterium]MBV6472128.1 Amidophosphoribosyltransferase [Saprospiraceae bacterium]